MDVGDEKEKKNPERMKRKLVAAPPYGSGGKISFCRGLARDGV